MVDEKESELGYYVGESKESSKLFQGCISLKAAFSSFTC